LLKDGVKGGRECDLLAMTPATYYDWWFYSGIRPGLPTRPANYAALREALSAPGVHLIVLWELLLDNDEFDPTVYVPPHGIHGSLERIIEAARSVGATGLADYLSTLPDSSIVPQTHRELKSLLKQFAAEHRAELTADIAHHGDPRAAPGFDKRQADENGTIAGARTICAITSPTASRFSPSR
jgi:hypothetical protein